MKTGQKLNCSNIVVVLVETKTAGNIGSVSRAMTNMGFDDLRLVNPLTDHLSDQAKMLAHGCNEFLEKIKVFPTLETAIQDCSLVLGTSHKPVRYNQKSFAAREIGNTLVSYCEKNKVAIVFGREDCGLSNDEINLCSWLVNIPSAREYPSLNLSQAVMLICYELYMSSLPTLEQEIPEFAKYEDIERFLAYITKILDSLGFHHKNNRSEIFVGTLRRVLTRIGIDAKDLKVFYKLFEQIESATKCKAQNSENPL
ncbi:MAG: RNA methyltransferase [Candidatus Brocadiae bacterium]|nr:RNA methyltransferase [Candidatus Brocadiia bacterium]